MDWLMISPLPHYKDYFEIYATYCHRDKFFDQLSKLCSMANSADHKEPLGTGDVFIAGMQYGS